MNVFWQSLLVEHGKADFSILLLIPGRLDQIQVVRAALAGVLDHICAEEDDVHSLGLAVTEILNNSIEHGYGNGTTQQIETHFQVCGNDVQIDIVDYAPPFPDEQRHRLAGELVPLELPSEEWETRGHGLQIVRHIVDSVVLESKDGFNRFTLRKRIHIRTG
jgi:anti-sigma regulatory factor (Ser/Thr protein kinase)